MNSHPWDAMKRVSFPEHLVAIISWCDLSYTQISPWLGLSSCWKIHSFCHFCSACKEYCSKKPFQWQLQSHPFNQAPRDCWVNADSFAEPIILSVRVFPSASHWVKMASILRREAGFPLLTVGRIFLGRTNCTNRFISRKLLCSLYGTPEKKRKQKRSISRCVWYEMTCHNYTANVM